jgi:multiple sugar transport system permease protein
MEAVGQRQAVRRGRGPRIVKYVPNVIRFILLCLLGIVFAFPFYWVLLTSLVPPDHIYDFPPSLLPRWHWVNYADAWQAANWTRYFINTAIICIATTVLTLITSVLAGYAFASMRFRGRNTIFALIFTSLIMPPVVMIIPDYVLAHDFGILNTYTVQIIPFAAGTFGIFLLLQFFRGMPSELWDAARMDGCSRPRYLLSVAVPLAGPVMTTVGLFVFLASYNSLLWPLVMTNGYGAQDPGVQPIEVGVYQFIGENGTAWHLLSAATVFTTLPVVIIFLLLQRIFVRGIMRSGLQG